MSLPELTTALPELKLPDTSVCPRCGAGLRCGMVAGDAECWCVQLPNIMPVPPAPGVLSENPQKAAPAAADAGSQAAPLPPAPASSMPDDIPPAASCFCPACLKQITDASIHAPSGANLQELASPPDKFSRPS